MYMIIVEYIHMIHIILIPSFPARATPPKFSQQTSPLVILLSFFSGLPSRPAGTKDIKEEEKERDGDDDDDDEEESR